MRDKTILGSVVIIAILLGMVIQPMLFPADARPAENRERTMERIVREGRINVCYIPYPPLTIKDPNTGELSGESIDAIEYIANEAELDIEYIETTWGTFSAALQSKQCDMIGTHVFTRIERAKSVSFTRPTFYIGNSALIREGDERFETLKDFDKEGIKIAVIQGEVGHLYAQKHLTNAELVVLPGGDISLALIQVSAGTADAAFTDAWTIEQYAKEHPETVDFLDINPAAAYGINPNSWAVRQEDTDLLNFLNTAIYDIEAEGKFLEWERKYGSRWFRENFEIQKREK